MSGPPIVLNPLPVGGTALLAFYGADVGQFTPPSGITSMTLSRAVSGTMGLGAFVQLYAGPPMPFWVDVGDGSSTSSQPLDTVSEYVWQATDANGVTQIGPAVLGNSIVTTPDAFTQLLIRLLQAALDNAPRPSGVTVQPAQVTTKMPSGGWPATPFVVINLDLFQQNDTAIGQDVVAPTQDNMWTLPGWAKRVWRISVFSQNADERDFYRDTLLIAFRALKATLFSQIGQNIRHSWQASSGTTSDEWIGQGPGFYWADVMYDLEGVFDVVIATGFGLIEQIQVDITATIEGGGTPVTTVVDVVRIPPSAPTPPSSPDFWSNGGALTLFDATLLPETPVGGTPGSYWSNDGEVSVVSGFAMKPPGAALYFPEVTLAQLVASDGAELPTSNPGQGTFQLWNDNDVVAIA